VGKGRAFKNLSIGKRNKNNIKQGVQIVIFPENSYGVVFDDSKRKEGEMDYIYLKKIEHTVFQPLNIIIEQ